MTQEFIGYNGSVIVDTVKVALKFKKSSGKADKEIYLQSISSIELKKPTLLNRGGYIKILFQGSQDNNNMKRFRDILSNENAVFFIGKSQYEAMIQAKQLIDKYISEYHQQGSRNIAEISYEEYEKKAEVKQMQFFPKKVECAGCGSSSTLEPMETKFCSYCGARLVYPS
ncbi:hypothetical protein EHS13_32105 [Paenibacillus psychroresistens]|uniref:Uncharacterized protein n=1 Tax=Paenibacillus psychroresistens TaxID=1778678 RepID=A0A6B8RTV0_9BACL|nr:hypothetical protein [Paenibacillus psychroresistens]QGQ99192.1 hypothetical protein EHS13_32105 [Paenibacillus psychroresistens]